MYTLFVVLVICVIYEKSEGSGRVQNWDRSSSVLYETISRTELLYHFDQVFTILEILVSEKADKFSFELRRILKRSVFLAVTRD